MITHKCKAIACNASASADHDFCEDCRHDYVGSQLSLVTGWIEAGERADPVPAPQTPTPPATQTLAQRYPKYYKPVGDLTEIDVYATHHLFNIQDPSGCVQHASKKLLLSGVRTGGKSAFDDIREARDTLTRWLQLNPQ